jgi:hypothetical protein
MWSTDEEQYMSFNALFRPTLDPMTLEELFPDMAEPSTYLDEEDVGTQQAAQAMAEQRHREIARAQPQIQEAARPPLRPLSVPELPQPSAPIAAAPQPRQRETADDSGGGYDWQRMLSSLLGGNEGVSTLDRRRAQDAQGKLAAQKEAREQAKFELERDLIAPSKAAERDAKTDKYRAETGAKALAIASTPESKAMVQTISSALLTQAQRLKTSGADPIVVQQIETAARNMATNPSMTGLGAIDAAKMFGRLGEGIVHEALKRGDQELATRKQDETEAQHDEQNKQAWARINAAAQRAANKPSERVRAQQAKDQTKLDDEIEKAEWARNTLIEIASLKERVNTGPLAGRAQNMLQTVDLASDDFNSLKQRLAQLSNRIIKELSGSAVTGNEWMRMQDELANILNDDRNFMVKLAGMIELTESIKQRAINRYTRMEDNTPSQRTNTAARVTAQTPKVMPGETPPPDATPKPYAPKPWPGAQPGQKKRDKATGIVWEMQADGRLKAVQ